MAASAVCIANPSGFRVERQRTDKGVSSSATISERSAGRRAYSELTFRAIVVEGWGRVPRVDVGKTFAPVCRIQSIRMVLAVAAEYDLKCWRLDGNKYYINVQGDANSPTAGYFNSKAACYER